MASRPAGLLPYFILIVGQLAVGSAAILARTGLSAGLEPVSLAAWRLTVAAVVLIGISSLRMVPSDQRDERHTRAQTRHQSVMLGLAGLLLGLHFAFWFASLQMVSVARSTLLVATGPLWTGLAERFLLKRTTPSNFWFGLALAGLGAYLVVTKGANANIAVGKNGSAAMGDILAILGAVAIAGYLLIAKELQIQLGSLRLIRATYSLAAVSLWPLALVTYTAFNPHPVSCLLPASSAAWGSVMGMALIPQLIGHTSFNWALKHFSAGAVATATLLEPAFAAALAWWLFGEAITTLQGLGGALLLLGVGLALWRQPR